MADKIVIGKSIPDLKSIEHTGKDGAAINHMLSVTLNPDEAYLRMVQGSSLRQRVQRPTMGHGLFTTNQKYPNGHAWDDTHGH